jgi:hypothetical protein
MANISRHERKSMMQCRRRDLEICVRKAPAGPLEHGRDLAVDARHRVVVREHGEGWKDMLLDRVEVPLAIARAKGPSVELADANRARELLLARDFTEPANVGASRAAAKNL